MWRCNVKPFQCRARSETEVRTCANSVHNISCSSLTEHAKKYRWCLYTYQVRWGPLQLETLEGSKLLQWLLENCESVSGTRGGSIWQQRWESIPSHRNAHIIIQLWNMDTIQTSLQETWSSVTKTSSPVDGQKWSEHVSNFEALERAEMPSVKEIITSSQLRWTVHTTRMENERIPKDIVWWSEGGSTKSWTSPTLLQMFSNDTWEQLVNLTAGEPCTCEDVRATTTFVLQQAENDTLALDLFWWETTGITAEVCKREKRHFGSWGLPTLSTTYHFLVFSWTSPFLHLIIFLVQYKETSFVLSIFNASLLQSS